MARRLVQVDLVRGNKGFGMVLGSDGDGVFVTEVTPGGPADTAFQANGLSVSEGLRFKTIGSVDVINAEKSIVKREMRSAVHDLRIVFMRDADGFTRLSQFLEADAMAVKKGDVKITLVKGVGGFGLTVGSNGVGSYVVALKPGGTAEMAFEEHGLSLTDGLKFKVIGDQNVSKEDKQSVLSHMRAAKLELSVVFSKDPDGFNALPASIRTPSSNSSSTPAQANVSREYKIDLMKTSSGYGLVLAADVETPGSGVFVRSVKPGSVAETVFKVWKLNAGDGLRLKTVGDVDVYKSSKDVVVKQMRASSDKLRLVIVKDPRGFAALPQATGVNRNPSVVAAEDRASTDEPQEPEEPIEIIKKEDLPDMSLAEAQDIVMSDIPRTDPKHIAARKVCLFAAQELERKAAAMGESHLDEEPPSPVELKTYEFDSVPSAGGDVADVKPAVEHVPVAVPKPAPETKVPEPEPSSIQVKGDFKKSVDRKYATEDERIRAEASAEDTAARLSEVKFDFNF